ncbi:MAG: TonB family protein [Porticoccaceae bacterium]
MRLSPWSGSAISPLSPEPNPGGKGRLAKARGYALGTLASIAVHALVLTLLALAWRADFQRSDLSVANTPIPVWLVADKKLPPKEVAPAASPLPPSQTPTLAAPPASPKPDRPRSPQPVRESAPEPAPAPAVQHPTDAAPVPPAPSPGSAAQGTATPPPLGDGMKATAALQSPPEAAQEPVSAGPGGITDTRIEREYRALSRPEPAYPHQALARGIEGYVVLEFTVTAAGTTRDLRVLEASPTDVFYAAALAAARQFRYQPRIQAGAPVDVPGVRSRIRFEIRPR